MKKLAFILGLGMIMTSCSKESDNESTVEVIKSYSVGDKIYVQYLFTDVDGLLSVGTSSVGGYHDDKYFANRPIGKTSFEAEVSYPRYSCSQDCNTVNWVVQDANKNVIRGSVSISYL